MPRCTRRRRGGATAWSRWGASRRKRSSAGDEDSGRAAAREPRKPHQPRVARRGAPGSDPRGERVRRADHDRGRRDVPLPGVRAAPRRGRRAPARHPLPARRRRARGGRRPPDHGRARPRREGPGRVVPGDRGAATDAARQRLERRAGARRDAGPGRRVARVPRRLDARLPHRPLDGWLRDVATGPRAPRSLRRAGADLRRHPLSGRRPNHPRGHESPADAADPYAYVAGRLVATPVWLFHGDADPAVPVSESRSMAEALRRAGGDVRYTEYAGVGHNSWESAYNEPELWRWLFAQRLGRRSPAAP